MGLDIRLPIGLMFTIIGAILAVFGLVSSDRSMSLGINVNLVWGGCILAFGLLMLASWKLIGRTPPAPHKTEPPPTAPDERRRGAH